MVPRKWLSAGDWASIPAGAEYKLEVGPEGCGWRYSYRLGPR